MQYLYDSLGRLTSAATLGPDWGQAYGFDGWGNLLSKTITKGTATTLNVAVDPATNRILSGPSYNANGNVTNLPGVGTIAYDGRNRQVGPITAPVRGYDASNRLIWRKVDDYMVDVDFYLPSGEKLGTYRTFLHTGYTTYDPDNPTCATGTGRFCVAFGRVTEYLHFAGRLIKTEGSTTAWVQQDRLGSAVTHLPYGDERTATANDRLKFATYWRESSGVDYAQQRYYSSTYGRFLTSDPYRASGGPSDPSSWNRYAYVQGDPVNNTDRTGMYVDNCLELICMISPLLGSDPVIGGGGGCFDPNGFLASTNPACYFLLTIVGAAPSPAPPPEPECFAQLKYRPVDDWRAELVDAQHSFWWIQDSTGARHILTGYPDPGEPKKGEVQYLTMFPIPGDGDTSDPKSDHKNHKLAWSSGLSSVVRHTD